MLVCSLAQSALVSDSTRPTSAKVLSITERLTVVNSVVVTPPSLVLASNHTVHCIAPAAPIIRRSSGSSPCKQQPAPGSSYSRLAEPCRCSHCFDPVRVETGRLDHWPGTRFAIRLHDAELVARKHLASGSQPGATGSSDLAAIPVQAEDHSVKKPHRHSPSNTAPPAVLAERGLDALRRDRFKEAVELFKQAIRVEPRPEWKVSLADAYLGRARSLATKGMFKEAAMVLENTIQLQGAVRDPNLFVSCLIRDGQQQKAAAYLLNHLPEQENLAALAAALLVSVPRLPDLAPAATPEQRRWHSMAMASRAALAAWCDGATATEIDRQLNAISLRSAFRPLRAAAEDC